MTDSKTHCDPNEIVSLMQAGDIQALDQMTRCFGERLINVGRRYCRTAVDAQDAVQNALLAAGEHLLDFRGDGSVEGWLTRMVANACRRMQRGRKNDPSMHVDVSEQTLETQQPASDDLAHRGEIAKALGKAMLTLSPEDRAILILAEAHQWKGPEIAKEFDLSPNVVRTRLTRMRARLRPHLAHLLE